MKFNKDLLKEKWFANTVALCSAVILYLALTHLNLLVHFAKGFWNVFSPVIMAIVIAYVLAPLVVPDGRRHRALLGRVVDKVPRQELREGCLVVRPGGLRRVVVV